MIIKLCFEGFKPVSLNDSTKISRYGGRKSSKYINLEQQINHQIRAFREQLILINEKYDEYEHYVTLDMRFYYPILTKDRTTKRMRISKTSMDIFNIPKTTEDCIFKHLIMDDSQVITGSSTKIHSKDIKMEVEIQLKPLRSIL
jgi:Holliday junction resolvase RusA-like endonuclease